MFVVKILGLQIHFADMHEGVLCIYFQHVMTYVVKREDLLRMTTFVGIFVLGNVTLHSS